MEKIEKTRVLVDVESKLLKRVDKFRKKKSTVSHKVSRRALIELALKNYLESEDK